MAQDIIPIPPASAIMEGELDELGAGMAGRRLRVRWDAADTVAVLRRAYRIEADAAVRLRLHGLWLLRSGRSVGEVAAALGVHYRTVPRWVRWYETGGRAGVRVHHQG